MARIYVDTNVYMDFFFDRKDKLRSLGDFAFELLRRTVACEFVIVVSDFVLYELEKFVDKDRIDSLFQWLEEHGKLERVAISSQEKAFCKGRTHWQDFLHGLVADRCRVRFLVTRNVKDFSCSSPVILPENL